MTTCCYDGNILAADTRQVGSYIDNHQAQKIHKIASTYIAIAGDVQQALVFIRWYKNQTEPRPDPNHMKDFEALVIKKGIPYYAADLCELVEIGSPCAIGSGCDYAMAAMLGGADAKQAVRIAMKLDPWTGGRVRSVEIKA